MTPTAGWENFYVIVGSSAGALIGLQFVVITLIADTPIAPGLAQAADAFATPTIVHFGTVLLAALSSSKRSMAWDRQCRSSLGSGGLRWDSLRRHRGSASASTNRIQAPV